MTDWENKGRQRKTTGTRRKSKVKQRETKGNQGKQRKLKGNKGNQKETKELKGKQRNLMENTGTQKMLKESGCRRKHPEEIKGTLVTPTFLDRKEGGDYKMVSFYAKRARGSMASWIIRNRVKTTKDLKDFAEDGYRFDRDRSEPSAPVFLRSN